MFSFCFLKQFDVLFLYIVIFKVMNDSPCRLCEGKGFLVQPSASGKSVSWLQLCECQQELCKTCAGDGTPPYIYIHEPTRTVKPCPCKPARTRIENLNRLFKESRIPIKYRGRQLKEFKVSQEDGPQHLIAYDNANHFLLSFPKAREHKLKGLFFYGQPGTGKTFLACLILNEVLYRYQTPVQYMKITRHFFNELRSSFQADSEMFGQGESLFNKVADSELLVIDDFGVQSDTDWEQRTLYDLIDARYETEKPTIITSNKHPEELKKIFHGRVFSRLKEMTEFQEMGGRDYRENFI